MQVFSIGVCSKAQALLDVEADGNFHRVLLTQAAFADFPGTVLDSGNQLRSG